MSRQIRDNDLIKTKALPAAGATAYTDSIDLGQAAAFPVNELIDIRVTVPAVANLVDAKTITTTIQDSADNSTFADIAGLASLVQTGAGGVGAAAATRTVKLPPSARRYIRSAHAVLAAGGDNTAVSATLEVLA